MKPTEIFSSVGISAADVRSRLKSGNILLNGVPLTSNKDIPVEKLLDHPADGLDLLNDQLYGMYRMLVQESSFGPEEGFVVGSGCKNYVKLQNHLNSTGVLRYSKKVQIAFKYQQP